MQPNAFRTVILERLRLPLDITTSRCECGGSVDNLGRHRAACPRSGSLRARAVVPERTLARVCREAGAVVRRNVKLRDMNTTVPVHDAREIEVLASGLPMHHGAQLAVDITLRSAVNASGGACANAATVNGAASWSSRLRLGDVGARKPSSLSTVWLQLDLVTLLPRCSGPRSWHGGGGGLQCWPFLVSVHLLGR